MKTTIIECAKNQSISSSGSRWTCSLKEGKVVNTGDLISVEGISINSIGIGGDIIEIPQEINTEVGTLNNSLDRPLSLFPNETYSPSAQSLVCGLYYHHNYKDTCGMPFSNYRAPPQIQGCAIDPNPSVVALNSNPNYGYILGDAPNLPSEKFEMITEYPAFTGNKTNSGTRFYAIAPYISNDNNGEEADIVNMTAPSTYNPANFIEWRLVSTELRFQVDKGYDSPENIATSINKQINMGWVSSASFQNELTTNFVGNNDGMEGQLVSNKGSIYTIPVNSNYVNTAGGGNYFYQLPFFLYPEYVSAGYNLISPLTEKVPVFNKDGLGSQSSQGEILNMNELPNNGVHLDFPQGTLLVSNIIWNSGNCDRVRKFLWSQGGYNGGYKIDPDALLDPQNETMTEKYYKEHPEIFSRYIDMGRVEDDVPVAPAGLTPYTLFTPIETVFNPDRDAVSSQLKMKISYTDERWDSAITPPNMVGGGVGMELRYQIVEEFLNIAGEKILAREMAKRYNINVVCVKCSSTDNPNPQPVIAFVLDEVAPAELKSRLYYSNFVLYDPAFYRRSNSSIKPIGWRKKIDVPNLDDTSILHYETTLQLGAPNPTFSFDEGLGRFQLSSLYWGHYLGSGESITGVAGAPEQVITMNKKGFRFGSHNNQINVAVVDRVIGDALDVVIPCLTLIYADSGIGLLYFGMKINNKDNKWDYIRNTYDINITQNVNSDNYSNTIVEPEKYFKNSLLYRLGWEYEDLFPTFGMARNLFLNNTYNQVPQLLLHNPVPPISEVNIYKAIFNLGVRPFTTNPYFSNDIATGLSINNYGQPMFDIHLQRGGGCNVAPVPHPAPPVVDAVPEYSLPQPNIMVSQPDLITPQPDIITPQPDLETIIPAVPSYIIYTPQPDLETVVPAVPAINTLYNYDTEGLFTRLETTDVVQTNGQPDRIYILPDEAGENYINFRDDGGLSGNYTNNNNRSVIFDAGAGNHIYVRINNLQIEASASQLYDRLGITASDAFSGLSVATGNLNTTTAPVLSPLMKTSATSAPYPNCWSVSLGSSSAGGWIFPLNSSTFNGSTWYKIATRYMRVWFHSDSSVVQSGWDIDIAYEERLPAVPSYIIYTPQPDLETVVPEVPSYIQYTPQPDLVEPQPDLVEPQPDISVAQPDLIIPAQDAYVDTDPIVINSINISTTTDFLSATRLPQKLEYPYWLVYSDIIGNVEFLGKGGEQNNILAIANRAYTSGDFAFNFATDYVFRATKDFVITDITTEILNPDYSSSTIADGTIVLYKIQSPMAQFNPPENQKAVRT